MKKFIVKASVLIEVPYELGLLDGQINKNHLMYIATARLQDGSTCMTWDGTKGTPLLEYSLDGESL